MKISDLKTLIKKCGVNEIQDYLNWLIEFDEEISEMNSIEERKKKLSGIKINGNELTYEEHFDFVIDDISRSISYVNVNNIDDSILLESGKETLEDVKHSVINLIDEITERINELENEL